MPRRPGGDRGEAERITDDAGAWTLACDGGGPPGWDVHGDVGGTTRMIPGEHELVELERTWMDAVRRKDLETLDRIVAPEYAYTASGQGRWTRQRWMETVSVYDIHRFAFDDVDVRAYGDTAVVLSRYRQEASVDGAPRSGDFLITDVWVRRDERWQVVARSSILALESSGGARG